MEDFDPDEEVYRRRMGMRQYFKELKMNIQRIERAKEQKAQGRSEDKKRGVTKTKKPKGEMGEGGESPGEKEKKSKTAAKVVGATSGGKKGGSKKKVAKK